MNREKPKRRCKENFEAGTGGNIPHPQRQIEAQPPHIHLDRM
jgi:hypothetical protein